MNTNYEAIKSLISLLVKKAGYDINSSYSEDELQKTKDTINNLNNNKNDSLTNEERDALIYNLKIRLANWENSAEVIGKELLKDYSNSISCDKAKGKIKLLINLANKDLENSGQESLMSYIYEKIKLLENDLNEIDQRINENNYFNEAEKELDIKLLNHLKSKIEKCDNEIKNINKELEELLTVQEKDNLVIEKIKAYIDNIKKDIDSLEKVKKGSLNKGITLEIWEKIETIELEIKEKLEKAKNVMLKSETMVKNANEKKELLNNNKKEIEKEIEKTSNTINDLQEKINNDDYVDYTKKVSDINDKELIRIELSELKNKKDVIYINVQMVEQELIREWSKETSKQEEISEEINAEPLDKEEKLEEPKEEKLEEKTLIESEEKIEETNNTRIEFDW